MIRTLIFAVLPFFMTIPGQSQAVYVTHNGKASFVSNAPLEVIGASSEVLEGAIDLQSRSFAFTIDNSTFKGFNSALQQEHFYENYMEIQDFPRSTFEGKIIGDIDPALTTEQVVRAKGILDIHGVQQERIIKGTVRIQGDTVYVDTQFTVPLEDHNIKIPRVVYQKIAEVIEVTITASLSKK